jgi:YggT family protein
MSMTAGQLADAVARSAALIAVVAALVVGLTHWGVRRRLLAPFGWWPRFVRAWSDPAVRPVERRLLASGGNPQDAPLWLIGVALAFGLLVIAATRWVLGTVLLLQSMQNAGARAWLRLAVAAVTAVLSLALIVRVIGSWLGLGRHNRWMRPMYFLTDWLVEPIRRRLPGFGALDLSPLLAYLLILIVRSVLLNLV